MAATYDPALPTDRDWVRLLLQDHANLASPLFSDEEIDAVLTATTQTITSPAARYFAAATLLTAAHTAWMSKGRGVASKKVEKLSIAFGTGAGINIDVAIQARIRELRIEGAHILCPTSKVLKVL